MSDRVTQLVNDPSRCLQHAIEYLIATRGDRAVKASRALQILANARHLCEQACIAELLGEKARALRIVCPCVKCQAAGAVLELQPPTATTKASMPPRDAKMRAAADDSFNGK